MRQFDSDDRVAALEAQLAEYEQTTRALTARLNAITASRGWALLHVLWPIRLRLAPVGSRRERVFLAAIEVLNAWRRDGSGAVARRSFHWLRRRARRKFGSSVMAEPARSSWYQAWIAESEPTEAQLHEQCQAAKELVSAPLISILTPVYNPAPEILDKTIRSVVDQTYEHWELCLVDGHSTRTGVRRILKRWASSDERIRVTFLPGNLGISGNSNEAVAMARGEFVALLDHDDLLAPFALFEMAKFLSANPDCDMVYSDEDKVDPSGRRHTPYFKPDWSPDLLLSSMYTGHLTVYRRDVVRSLGGFRPEFDFSQDYDLALRVTEVTDRIGHIAKVLYHWQVLPGSAAGGGKLFARESNVAALASAAERRGYDAQAIGYPFVNRVKFNLQGTPLVSIVVPTDNERNIFPCLDSLFKNTRYPDLEILVVTNTSLAARIGDVYGTDSRVRLVRFDDPFNFSAKCNRGAEEAKGEYVLFLNDDIEPVDEAWIECLLGYFQQAGVGAVSPKLTYDDGLVQHGGLVTGVRGFIGTAFHLEPSESVNYFSLLQSTRTVSALPGACLLMPKRLFESLGGFDEVNTPILHSDIDLCLKIRERGLRLVYVPFTSLRHKAHVSLVEIGFGHLHSGKADVYLLKRWGGYLSYDPYYTENMRDLLYRDSPTTYRMYASNRICDVRTDADILFVAHDLGTNVPSVVTHALATYIQHAGYFVSLMVPAWGELLHRYREDDIPVVIDPLVDESPSAPEIEYLVRSHDVVIVDSVRSWRMVDIAKSLGKPVIWLIHETQPAQALADSDGPFRRALAAADVVVFPCRWVEENYRGFGVRCNSVVLHYGAKVAAPCSEMPHVPQPNRFHVVQVGNIEPREGQDVLVKCIDSLAPNLRDALLFSFVGRPIDSDYFSRLRMDTAEFTNVRWVDEVCDGDALRYVSDSDVVVHAPRGDPSSLTVLEAMALGKAVISTDVGAVAEVIQQDVSGIIIDVDDHDALAMSIVRLYRNQGLLRTMGDAARRRYEEHLTLDRYGDGILDLVRRVAPAPVYSARKRARGHPSS